MRTGDWGKPEAFLSPDALRHIVAVADGDARVALNALEAAVAIDGTHTRLAEVDMGTAEEALSEEARFVRQGRGGALQPDLRPPQRPAVVRPGRRPLLAGADALRGGGPLYVARRMIRFASEDIEQRPRRGRCRSRWRRRRRTGRWEAPKGNSHWRRGPCTSPTALRATGSYTPGKATRDAENGGGRPGAAATCGTPPPWGKNGKKKKGGGDLGLREGVQIPARLRRRLRPRRTTSPKARPHADITSRPRRATRRWIADG